MVDRNLSKSPKGDIQWHNMLNPLCIHYMCVCVCISCIFQENGDGDIENGMQRGVQYPFSVNEKVFIKVSVLSNESIANIWFL